MPRPDMTADRLELHDEEVTRRDFLVRAGHAGWAVALLGPGAIRRVVTPGQGLSALHAAPDGPAPLATPPEFASLYSGLRWRLLGPFRGGRTDAVSGVPGRPNEFYFGHVNGGVWKTIDAGRVWEPIFDGQPVASIGAIAVAPSAPDVVYVVSGESTLRDSTGFGD